MIHLNGQGYTVAGVLGPGVEFPRGAGFWYPLGVEESVVARRTATFLQAIARVRSGAARERVVAEVKALVRRLALEHPEAYSHSQQAVVTPLIQYVTGSARIQLWILLGASVLLFCASALSASLLIISGVLGRGSEIATRIALGASQRHIIAQLAAEGMFLSSLACATGLVLAGVLIRLLIYWSPSDIPRIDEASLNAYSIAFAMVAAAIAGLACSILPGLPAIRMRVESVLREGSARLSLSRRSMRTRNLFILAQSSVTVMVLMLSGLFLMSYRALLSADIGFAHRDALSVNLQLRGPGLFAASKIDPNWRLTFYRQLLDRLRDSPGITSAAAILVRPLEGPIGWDRGYEFEFDRGRKEETLPKANFESITPQYFETLGTPLLKGRDFDEHDSEGAALVVIISRNLARQIEASGRSPLGQRIRFAGSSDWLTIVGVCGDARYRSVAEEDASVFVPYRQSGTPTPYVVIRGSRSKQELSSLIRRVLASMDGSQAVAKDATIGEMIDANMARQRFNMNLLVWFAVFVAALVTTGIYGIIAESTAAREREIAIRLALGASRRQLVKGLISKTLVFAFAGEVIGVCGMIPVSHWTSNLLYGISPSNSILPGFILVSVSVACLVASCVPAWAAVNRNSVDL
jgi:predicted permease